MSEINENNEPRLVLVMSARVRDFTIHEQKDSGEIVFHEIKEPNGSDPITLRRAVNIAREQGFAVKHWAEVEGDHAARVQPILF